jgi:GNAT superfamily N-acetyltransferase
MSYELRRVATESDWEAYHAIRERVLWAARGRRPGEYDRNHPDDHAAGHYPLLLLLECRPVGALRVDVEGITAWVRRVAIREDVQRCGHGRRMLELTMEFARTLGCRLMRSVVDVTAVGFYRKLGFREVEGVDTTAGPQMQRPLTGE